MDLGKKSQSQAPATDDQELAKVLESMNKDVPAVPIDDPQTSSATDQPDASSPLAGTNTHNFEEPPVIPPTSDSSGIPSDTAAFRPPEEENAAMDTPTVSAAAASDTDSGLDGIKKDALTELRPLVDKLDLPADEKFDTLLLLIRSTDDKSLISQAHDTAKMITDDTKRAGALLDIIKEIDYFSNPQA